MGTTFTEYDVPSAIQTNLLGINELGDLTGGFDPDGSGIFQGFIDRHGTITSFGVPAAASTFTYELNNTKRLAVGYYIDGAGILHGYYRDHNGALHFPIDPPGSVATVLFGVSDFNFVVGRYADASGATHGLFFTPPDIFFTFDYPGSTFTSLNGINLFGFICGRFNDAAGIGHGFIARLEVSRTEMGRTSWSPRLTRRRWPLHSTSRLQGGEVQCRSAEPGVAQFGCSKRLGRILVGPCKLYHQVLDDVVWIHRVLVGHGVAHRFIQAGRLETERLEVEGRTAVLSSSSFEGLV